MPFIFLKKRERKTKSALHFFKKRERKKKRVSFVRASSRSDHKTPTHDLFFFPFKFFLFFCFCDTELQAVHFFFQVMLSDGLVYERAANALFFFSSFLFFFFQVILSDGHVYERAAIDKWLRFHSTSPKTNQLVEPVRYILNVRTCAHTCAHTFLMTCRRTFGGAS